MPEPERDATPEEEDAVRRLLAGARHEDPLPVDVAVRLDAVLSQLADGDVGVAAPEQPDAEVVELAARRRRRATALLVAAAAVVAVGVGVGQVVGTDEGADTAATDRSEGAAREGDAAGSNDSADVDSVPPGAAPESASPSPGGASFLRGELPRIAPRTFARDVRRLQDARGVLVTSPDSLVTASQLSEAPGFVCATAPWGQGRLVAVVYAGNPAVLAYRPARGETQSVDVLQCGTGDVVRSTTLPLP